MNRWMARLGAQSSPRSTSANPAEGGWSHFVDVGPTGSRSFAVYTPPGLRLDRPVPLVVVLHGCNQTVEDAALGTKVNVFADRIGFVAVYPEQTAADNPRRCWNWFEPDHQVRGSGEPESIARITNRVLSSRDGPRLDRNRVHVMGLSAGGAMAGILAATYPDLYASVGIHSAPQYCAARTPLTALLAMKTGGPDPEQQGHLAHAAMGPRARVVPVIVFQGAADRTVWAGNGDRVVRQWLTSSRLASGPEQEFDFNRPDTGSTGREPGGLSYSVSGWNDIAGRPVVQYWMVEDLGHGWSGGASEGTYTEPGGPSATEAMCDFFARCPRDRDLAVDTSPVVTSGSRRAALRHTFDDLGRRVGRWSSSRRRRYRS